MKFVIGALLLASAVPAAAQMPPPAPEAGGYAPYRNGAGGHAGMFAGLSPAGRAIMRAALKSADPRADHEATRAARDRMLAVLEADRLDVVTLRRAMDDEREAANAAKVRHQAALIAGFQQLSLADRRAFVADARAVRERVEERVGDWRAQRGGMTPPPQ